LGFFDFRCPISNLSLRAARAVHIPLIELTAGRWSPVGLPLVGTYDRLGSIDGFVADFRVELLVAGFARMAAAGRIDARGAAQEFAEFTASPSAERLLRLFERTNTMRVPFTLDGKMLRQVLIHAEVFADLASTARLPHAPDAKSLAAQLARAEIAPQARELLEPIVHASDEVRHDAAVALTQLKDLTSWLAAHGKRWSPRAEFGQYDAPEDLRIARLARAKAASTPELVPAIDRVVMELEQERPS